MTAESIAQLIQAAARISLQINHCAFPEA